MRTPPLSRDRWEEIRTRFEDLVELQAPQRAARLAAIARKDPELRAMLDALLAADASANERLAPVESPLGFVPSAHERIETPDVSVAFESGGATPRSLLEHRWFVTAVTAAVLLAGTAGYFSVRSWLAPDTTAVIPVLAPSPDFTAPRLSLVAVSFDGAERPLSHTPSLSAGSGAPGALDTGYYAWPKISPDGKRVALEKPTDGGQWDVWTYDLDTRRLTRLTDGFTGVRPLGWSPDSRHVLYVGVDNASIEWPHRVLMQPWDGSAPPREVLRVPFAIHDVALAGPKGDVVIREQGNDDLWLASLDTPGAVRRLVATRASEVHPRLSRDGALLAYASDETETYEVYVQSITDPAVRVQVSRGGGTQPVWSPDGRHLFYRAPEHMMRATIGRNGRLTVERTETLFADVYERHNNVTNYDVFPGGRELLMIRAR